MTPEERDAIMQKIIEADKARLSRNAKKYREKNKDSLLKRQAAYREANREKLRESGKVAQRRYYAKSPEAVKANKQRWKDKNPGWARKALLKRQYDLTTEEWEVMFHEQGRKCAICKASEPGHKSGWHTDHCHISGKVRGIICCHCNRGLGGAKDNIETLENMIDYLREHQCQQLLTTRRRPAPLLCEVLLSAGS